jgi:hypothetical protein
MPAPLIPFADPKPHLVVVRAGASSLHSGWLDIPHETRSWDLIISYFNEDAYQAHQDQPGVQAVLVKGGKWDGLFKTFAGFAQWRDYAHIWLPDDDIATNGDAINAMFAQAQAHDLAVCQPALSHDSYFSHFLFMACPGFVLRYTNYIEIMIPCLSRDLFAQALPLFEGTMSGFGLDYIWCRLPAAGRYRAAILDEIAMVHTRPVGTQLKGAVADQKGESSKEEGRRLRTQMGRLKKAVPLAYAGLTADGRTIEGRLNMALEMRAGYLRALGQFSDPQLARTKTRQLVKRQLIKRLSLSPIEAPGV